MGSKTNTKSCLLFPQETKLFPGFIICFMHKGSELPCFYSWLSVYSLALEELLLCKNYLRNGSSKAKQQKHPWTKNATKKQVFERQISKQLVRQKPATPTGPTDDFSPKSLTLTLTSEMLSEVDLSGRAEGWVVETGKTGKTQCWWQVQNLPWVLESVLLKCLRSHTSLHMYSRWIRTASHRRRNQFRWFSKQHFHTCLLFPWLYTYISIYTALSFTNKTDLTLPEEKVSQFLFWHVYFLPNKKSKNWCVSGCGSFKHVLFSPRIYTWWRWTHFDLRIFFKRGFPSFWRRPYTVFFSFVAACLSASTDPPTKFWVSGLGHVDSLHLELLYWRLRVHWPRRKGGAQVRKNGVGRKACGKTMYIYIYMLVW